MGAGTKGSVMYKSFKIENDLKIKITSSIEQVVRDVFNNYFGINVSSDNISSIPDNHKSCLCQARIFQEGIDMFLCFNFDANLLYGLVDENYAGEEIKDMTPYNDAGCEIVNIVCCRIKSILNGNGYRLNMDIPYAVSGDKNFGDSINAISLHFSTSNGSGFFVNLFTLENGQ